jgi:hypothetical protein
VHPAWHLKRLQNFAGSRIDSPQVALVVFPGCVPEFSIDPRDSGDEPIGLDGAKNGPCFGVDLVNLPVTILADPESPFCPGQPRVSSAA